jgi:hypothetical protein
MDVIVSIINVTSVPLSLYGKTSLPTNFTPTFPSTSLASSSWRALVPFRLAWLTYMVVPVDSLLSWWRTDPTDVLRTHCNRSFYSLFPTLHKHKLHIAVVDMAWLQVSATVLMRYQLFWDFTQRRMVISYRRFRTTYRSHLQRSSTGVCLPSAQHSQ